MDTHQNCLESFMKTEDHTLDVSSWNLEVNVLDSSPQNQSKVKTVRQGRA